MAGFQQHRPSQGDGHRGGFHGGRLASGRLHSLEWTWMREWLSGFDLDGLASDGSLDEREVRILQKRYGLGEWMGHPMTFKKIGASEPSRKAHLPNWSNLMSHERARQLTNRGVASVRRLLE